MGVKFVLSPILFLVLRGAVTIRADIDFESELQTDIGIPDSTSQEGIFEAEAQVSGHQVGSGQDVNVDVATAGAAAQQRWRSRRRRHRWHRHFPHVHLPPPPPPTSNHLRFCDHSRQCSFFGTFTDKPVDEKQDETKQDAADTMAYGESQSSYFVFTVDASNAGGVMRYQLRFKLFLQADAKKVQEAVDVVGKFQQTDTGAAARAALQKIASDHGGEFTAMKSYSTYFEVSTTGTVLNLCCHSEDIAKGLCEFKKMIIMSAINEMVNSQVMAATEDMALELSDDDPRFDAGTSKKHHFVHFDGQRRHIGMVHHGRKMIELDTEWEIPPAHAESEIETGHRDAEPMQNELEDSVAVSPENALSTKSSARHSSAWRHRWHIHVPAAAAAAIANAAAAAAVPPAADMSAVNPTGDLGPTKTQQSPQNETQKQDPQTRCLYHIKAPFVSAEGVSNAVRATLNSNSVSVSVPVGSSWIGDLGSLKDITSVAIQFKQCYCSTQDNVMIDVGPSKDKWRRYSIIEQWSSSGTNCGSNTCNSTKILYANAKQVRYLRISTLSGSTKQFFTVKAMAGCAAAPGPYTSPLITGTTKGDSWTRQREDFRNPSVPTAGTKSAKATLDSGGTSFSEFQADKVMTTDLRVGVEDCSGYQLASGWSGYTPNHGPYFDKPNFISKQGVDIDLVGFRVRIGSVSSPGNRVTSFSVQVKSSSNPSWHWVDSGYWFTANAGTSVDAVDVLFSTPVKATHFRLWPRNILGTGYLMDVGTLQGTGCGYGPWDRLAAGHRVFNNVSPNNAYTVQQGKLGVQQQTSRLTFRRIGQPSVSSVVVTSGQSCPAGMVMLQVNAETGHGIVDAHNVDPATPLVFDVQKFKKMISKPEYRMQGEFRRLAENLGHVHNFDRVIRSGLADGSVSPRAAGKWLALLGGTNHDLAEEVLVRYIRDDSVPSAVQESAMVSLLTPRKRKLSTIEALLAISNQQGHEHRDLGHMLAGALLKRYGSLEHTNHMPRQIEDIYRELEQKASAAADPKELATALGALANTRWDKAIPHLILHMDHPHGQVRQTVAHGLKSMKVTVQKRSEAGEKHAEQNIDQSLLDDVRGTVTAEKRRLSKKNDFSQQAESTRFANATVEGPSAEKGGNATLGGETCNDMFTGSIICYGHNQILTESDHHKIELLAGFGLGLSGGGDDGTDARGSKISLKGEAGLDVMVGNDGEPVRMIGFGASIERSDQTGMVDLICTITVCGYAVPANLCDLNTNQRSRGEEDLLQGRTESSSKCNPSGKTGCAANIAGSPDLFGAKCLCQYDFDEGAGLLLEKTFYEVTFVSVSVKMQYWFLTLTLSLTASGETKGAVGFNWDTASSEMTGGVRPSAAAVLTVELALSVIVAQAGVGGEIQILDASLAARGAWKPFDTFNDAEKTAHEPPACFGIDVVISLASGRLYAFAEFGISPFSWREEVTIVEWPALATQNWPIYKMCTGGSMPQPRCEAKTSSTSKIMCGGAEVEEFIGNVAACNAAQAAKDTNLYYPSNQQGPFCFHGRDGSNGCWYKPEDFGCSATLCGDLGRKMRCRDCNSPGGCARSCPKFCNDRQKCSRESRCKTEYGIGLTAWNNRIAARSTPPPVFDPSKCECGKKRMQNACISPCPVHQPHRPHNPHRPVRQHRHSPHSHNPHSHQSGDGWSHCKCGKKKRQNACKTNCGVEDEE